MPLSRRHLIAASGALLTMPSLAHARSADWQAVQAYSDSRRGVSLLVLRDGETLHEAYSGGGAVDRAWELASGTKSFCAVLAAAMVQDGLLSLDETCAEILTEWRDDAGKSTITLRDLLTLTAGVGSGRIGRPPTYAQAVALPLTAAPRTRFLYGPAPFQVFGEIVRRKLVAAGQPDDVLAFIKARILTPLGVEAGYWRTSAGQPHLPSGAHLTARNWAAFGQAVLEGGRGVADPAALAAGFQGTALNPGYGLCWWLLRPGLIGPGRRSGLGEEGAGIAARADVRMAAGAGNQRLYLIPEHRVVVVRQAWGIGRALRGDDAGWSDADFMTRVLDAIGA